jgi:hypothetical protein
VLFLFAVAACLLFAPGAQGAEVDAAVFAPVSHLAVGGEAAASPNASAADWFDGESFDQTDGFGDERGDLARNVRPKHDAGAFSIFSTHGCSLLVCQKSVEVQQQQRATSPKSCKIK